MDIRSFLAFSIPGEIRDVVELVHGELKDASSDVKWVPPSNVHLTVVFLGNVKEASVPEMARVVRRECAEFAPFNLAVNGIGFFPNPRRPRIVWLGLKGDVERMGLLRDRLQEALTPFGIEPERRPFRAHLTLGRFRRDGFMNDRLARAVDRYAEVGSTESVLSELVLYKSKLHRTGAAYTALERFPLKGGKEEEKHGE